MHIPLDYYRVLGLPIQATSEQLSHAHRDRTLQLPRREFSEWAIAARRQLIDEAYAVLSDSAQRQIYDSSFLAKSYNVESAQSRFASDEGQPSEDVQNQPELSPPSQPPGPTIDIHDNQFVGALLLLYELGEYELVLKLGRPYLSSGDKSLSNGQLGDPKIVGADIVLTIALSCLELGREQWQQSQYEAAAESLETGQELLLREGLFASVRGEIQSDLYKLRPYRILELLALPIEREVERYQGVRLLQDILQDRMGIDGQGNDQSGLSTDDFLRFVQQLRSYLTVAEQQQLFDAEASRPSAVGTYLAVYAFIAGGFAHRQPALVQRAQQLLASLGGRQDIRLEQSVCSLLLGQTEEANQLVERSQEKEALAYIRKHSDGSPDLLPGLCLYAEQWLRAEVFPQFRDLHQEDASLKGYFADHEVQAYLEDLPSEEKRAYVTRPQVQAPVAKAPRQRGQRTYAQDGRNRTAMVGAGATAIAAGAAGAAAATLTRDRTPQANSTHTTTLRPAERAPQTSPEGSLRRPSLGGTEANGPGLGSPPLDNVPQGTVITQRNSAQTGPRLDRLLFLAVLGVLGVLIMWLIASRIYSWLNQATQPKILAGEQLELPLNEAPIFIPTVEVPSTATLSEGELDPQGAEEVIRTWLEAKKAAMGPDYNNVPLDDILVGDLLARWKETSRSAKVNGFHKVYEYPNLTVDDVTWSPDTPDEASISVSVTEVSEFYQGDQIDLSESEDNALNVVYGLIRDNGRWKIRSNSLQ